MKKIKILLLLLTVAVGGFYSCTDNNPVENEIVATKSISLRTTLNEIKKAQNISGKNGLTTQDQFCFNFLFPINLEYNNGTTITVTTYDGLIDILTNETSELYIDGIEFPFIVLRDGAPITINNEDEFYALIQQCDFVTVNDCLFDFTCYEIVSPISIINQNNETVVIHNQTELMQHISAPNGTSTYQLNIVFPISVIQNNQTIFIHDLYEFFELNNDCSSSSCVCPMVYQPVCVQTPVGIVEYSNECFAQCAGFTSADFVNCNPTTTYNFGQLLGNCFSIAYPAQVQYQGAIVNIHNDTETLQYWFPAQGAMPHFNYPITVSFAGVIAPYVFNNQAEFEAEIAIHCN